MGSDDVLVAPESFRLTAVSITIGRGVGTDLRLMHPTVSRKHATLARRGSGYCVEDHDSRFGTFVNGIRVQATTVTEGDLLQFGLTSAYRVTREGLQKEKSPSGLCIEAVGLSLYRGQTKIVEDLHFRLEPNSFVGILGPSGCGKSTLLNCLAGSFPDYHGSLQFEEFWEAKVSLDRYRGHIGYVPQDDDHLRSSLCVRETLSFAAQIRNVDTAIEVDRVLEQLGLVEHSEKRTAAVSGGQRKRLSVGFELLKRPRLLLLDEPTSGLDPGSEAQLMEHLRQVSNRGTTVICTTHLMPNLRLFDCVLVLGVKGCIGRLAHYGSAATLLTGFDCRDLADVYERLSKGQFDPIEGPRQRDIRPAEVPKTTIHADKRISPVSVAEQPRKSLSRVVMSTFQEIRPEHIRAVVSRNCLTILRDRNLLIAMIAQPVGLGLLAALTQFDAPNVVPLLFFAVVIAVWLGLNNSVRELVRERRLYVRDRSAGLSAECYLCGKALTQLTVGAIQIVLLLLVLVLTVPHCVSELAARDFQEIPPVRSLIVLLLSYSGGMTLGLLLSTVMSSEASAVAAMPLVIMPQLMISLVATGLVSEPVTRARPFRPLAMSFSQPMSQTKSAKFLDLCSVVCFSRPATLAWEAKVVKGHSNRIWLLDLAHLVVLVLAASSLTVWMFRKRDRQWRELKGVD